MRPAIGKVVSLIDPQAWLRFFAALVGLALAFGCALYSTVFRDEGNLFATALLASLALVLAAAVGILSVPYLFKRVTARRLRERFQYEFTTEGGAYMLLLVVIIVAALNTGNNMLYIIVAAMLAAILISGIASAGMLRALELDLALPTHIFAAGDVLGRITLNNERLWMPALSVSVAPLKRESGRRWQRGSWGFPPKRPREKQWFQVKDWIWAPVPAGQSEVLSGSIYFPYVARLGSATADVVLRFPRRGRYQQDKLGLNTRFPFSFLSKTRLVSLGREIVVYPPVEQTDDLFRVLPMITGEFEVFVRGRSNNLYLIREHMPEDSARHVDWKATAKTGALKVREFTREDERKVRIVFDNASADAVPPEAYEHAVSMAASLGWFFARSETQISFVASGYRGGDVYEFLRALALVQPAEGDSLLPKLEISDDYNVIVTAQSHGSIPTSLWACSYLLFMQEMGDKDQRG